jgi:hypothetical protein
MNWKQKATDARELADRLTPNEEIPFDELAESGIVLPVIAGLAFGPSTLELCRLALYEKAEMYDALHLLKYVDETAGAGR